MSRGYASNGWQPRIFHATATITVARIFQYIQLEFAGTTTLWAGPLEGDTFVATRDLVSGTPTLAAGSAGSFWRDGDTSTSFDYETDGGEIAGHWDGTNWRITGLSGVFT